MKNQPHLLETSLFKVWNERDADTRLSIMDQIYSRDIEFFESDGAPAFVGHEKINALISKLQSDWAPDFQFFETEPTQVNQNIQIASWTLGASNQDPVAKGKDVALIENGKIAKLYLFLG